MRSVGTITQQAIDTQVLQRAVRVSVYDEAGTEILVPLGVVLGIPTVRGDLDGIGWRMTLEVLVTDAVTGIFLRGRTIQAWDVFASGEDLSLFKGRIADPRESHDWSEGHARSSLQIECIGTIADRLDAFVTSERWDPVPFPALSGDDRLTGIVKRYRLTPTYGGSDGRVTVTGDSRTDAVETSSTTGFADGDTVYLSHDNKVKKYTIDTIAGPIMGEYTIFFNETNDPSVFPTGSVLQKGRGELSFLNWLYFPDTAFEEWVTVYDESGAVMTSGTDYVLNRDVDTGVFCLDFATSPGSKYTIDVLTVDRWVALSRRTYHNGTSESVIAPYYYVLAGIQGDPDAERLNDPAKTRVKASPAPTASVFYVEDPAGIFAVDVHSQRWVSVWAGGVEYRGKVQSVDKVTGEITVFASYPLRSATGTAYTPVGGEEAGNTSTLYHEILPTTGSIPHFRDAAGNDLGQLLKGAPYGGFWLPSHKTAKVTNIIPSYDQNLAFRASAWNIRTNSSSVVMPAAGSFKNSDNLADNDVSAWLKGALVAVGVPSGDFTSWQATGYTLAPFQSSQARLGDLIDQVRKATIPPNWRLRESEDGKPVGGYVVQLPAASLTLRGVRSFKPRELPKALTRVIVKGQQHEIERAGQLLYRVLNIGDQDKLFDGRNDAYTAAATFVSTGSNTGSAWFKIPPCEPGRWPGVSKVSVSADAKLLVNVAGAPPDNLTGEIDDSAERYLPKAVTQQDATARFISHEFADLDRVALQPSDSLWGTYPYWYLRVNFDEVKAPFTSYVNAGTYYIDEIDLYMLEGPYWEASLTDDTDKAPANGASGAAGFSATWKQPDRTLAMSYRFAPTAWLKRNMADYGTGGDRVLVVEAEGITQGQCREIAEAYLDGAVRGSEFYDVEAAYDPRVQLGDTVAVPLDDGTTRTLLVWGISKGATTMQLTLADYSR